MKGLNDLKILHMRYWLHYEFATALHQYQSIL